MRALTLLPLLLLAPLFLAQEPAKKFKPYKYKKVELEGWTVLVQKELNAKSDLRDQVLKLLEVKLWEIAYNLPKDTVERLRKVPIRMHLDREGCPGGVYHPSKDWLRENGFPQDWAEGVEFGNAKNFLGWSRQQPAMVLHELAHAWHHQVLTYEHEGIKKAYQDTKSAGTLDTVTYVMGGEQVAYGLNNEMEFFAEMSEAWWSTNDMYPFVRGELMKDFPDIRPLMESSWKLP